MTGFQVLTLIQVVPFGAVILSLALLAGFLTRPAEATEGAVVSNVKVVSDKIEDVSSIEAWKASFLKPGMSDRQKALAVWETVVKFRHQNSPPYEYLQSDGNEFCVHDPIKTFNVYGYGMCCCAASNIEALARAAGFEARGRALNVHSVPEVFWDGKWHMLDASIMCWFDDAHGRVADIDEILENVAEWYARHPGFKGDNAKLRAFMKNGGWEKGPSIFVGTPFFDENGKIGTQIHGWNSVMHVYDGSVNFPYEFGYSEGYRVNVELRPGKVLTRNWSNKGLYVDMDSARTGRKVDNITSLTGRIGKGEFAYARDYGDLAPGRIGNGTLVYEVPLAKGISRIAPLGYENIASKAEDGASPALHVKSPGLPGTLTIRMPSSYVYLSGTLQTAFTVGQGGSMRLFLSRNNGLDWKEIYTNTNPGAYEETLDLTPLVYRLYDYRLKFELMGTGTGLDALRISHDIQHSQRALPALGPGENTITFSASPNEGTVTIEGLTRPEGKGNQLSIMEYRPVFDGVACTERGLKAPAAGGTITLPIETPGDMVRLRMGCSYQTRARNTGWDFLVSFDGGDTWLEAGRVEGGLPGMSGYVTFPRVGKPTRKALVRFAGGDDSLVLNLRIDADYKEPRGAFRPVRITYIWEEAGLEKRDVHVAKTPRETYQIHCSTNPGSEPVMKSLVVKLDR